MFVIIAAAVVIFDQISKALIVANLPYHSVLPFVGELLQLTYIHNTGASFSIMQGRTGLLVVFSTIVTIGIIIAWCKTPKHHVVQRFCFALIVGGALGNLIDRVRLGYVVDFLMLPNFPVFNLADCALVLGVALLCLTLIFEIIAESKKDKKVK